MSKDDLLEIARNDTPDDVHVPPTWAGIGVWMLGKYGVGAIFMGMLVLVYLDLKEANERYARISESTVTAMQALVTRIDASHDNLNEMKETVRRIEMNSSKN